jgi:transposase
MLGPGQQNDMVPACDLIDGLASGNVIVDKAYDADRLFQKVIDQGGDPAKTSPQALNRHHEPELISLPRHRQTAGL